MKADASVAELSSAINRTAFPTWETHEAMRALQLTYSGCQDHVFHLKAIADSG